LEPAISTGVSAVKLEICWESQPVTHIDCNVDFSHE
jgi:hypothetical protein